MSNILKTYLFFCILITGMISCRNGTSGEKRDTPKSGELTVSIDETFQPFMQAEVEAFGSLNAEAHVTPEYKSEAQCIQDLLERKTRVILVSRQLTRQEKKTFEPSKIVADENRIAYDGIALIGNKSNPENRISLKNLKRLMTGEAIKWSDFSSGTSYKGAADSIVVVFDQAGSSTIRFIQETISEGHLPQKVYAAGSNPAVIEYVKGNPAAIGIIGLNWISDIDDSISRQFRSDITVYEVEAGDSSLEKGEYFQPYAGYIADGNYPLIRPVYIISTEPYLGLGTGFVHFVAGEKGQRVILRAGLMPGYTPVRVVEFPAKDDAQDIHDYLKQQKQK